MAVAAPDIGDRATITSFTTTSTFVNRAELEGGTARVPVADVANRPVTANLYFEQVMPDGSAINVELPRDDPWRTRRASASQRRNCDDEAETILLRVRLIDLLDGRSTISAVHAADHRGDQPAPAIMTFTAGATSVDVNQLAARNAYSAEPGRPEPS